MICADCKHEIAEELAWFICECGLCFAVQLVDGQLDLYCPSGHVYTPQADG